jgi:hypothetical protein
MPFLVVPAFCQRFLPFPGPAQHGVRTDKALAKLDLLQPVDLLMHVKDNMRPVRDVYAAVRLEAMFFKRLELLEEARDVDDTAAADDVDAVGVHEAGGQDVKVVGDAVGDDGVARIVTTLGAAADLRLVGENIGELALAFVAPLGAEDNRDGHVRIESARGEDGCSSRRGFNCPWDAGAGAARWVLRSSGLGRYRSLLSRRWLGHALKRFAPRAFTVAAGATRLWVSQLHSRGLGRPMASNFWIRHSRLATCGPVATAATATTIAICGLLCVCPAMTD